MKTSEITEIEETTVTKKQTPPPISRPVAPKDIPVNESGFSFEEALFKLW